MLYQTFASATGAVRDADSAIGRLADGVGMAALLVMGLAMGALTAFVGL